MHKLLATPTPSIGEYDGSSTHSDVEPFTLEEMSLFKQGGKFYLIGNAGQLVVEVKW